MANARPSIPKPRPAPKQSDEDARQEALDKQLDSKGYSSRPVGPLVPLPRRTDPVKARAEQARIAQDLERRLRIQAQGDTYQAPPKPSPPEKGLEVPLPRRRRRISSQGIATFKKGSNVI